MSSTLADSSRTSSAVLAAPGPGGARGGGVPAARRAAGLAWEGDFGSWPPRVLGAEAEAEGGVQSWRLAEVGVGGRSGGRGVRTPPFAAEGLEPGHCGQARARAENTERIFMVSKLYFPKLLKIKVYFHIKQFFV